MQLLHAILDMKENKCNKIVYISLSYLIINESNVSLTLALDRIVFVNLFVAVQKDGSGGLGKAVFSRSPIDDLGVLNYRVLLFSIVKMKVSILGVSFG